MTEIEHYRGGQLAAPAPAATVALPPANDVDGWVRVVGDVSRLAAQIAHTDFVPKAMQGKPAAIAAAMLAGREMGIGPMTSLQNIHVIQGKPGQSALLMRALVLSKGHQIEFVETTDSRCVMRGRRLNEEDWTEVEFTADQARKAKIDLGGYPVDKLVARASARLCRRKFADVISGMGYSIEELQDGDAGIVDEIPPALTAGIAAAEQPAAAPRTAQRKTRTVKTSGQQAAPAARSAPAAAAPPLAEGPPLPGEHGYDEPAADEPPPDPNRPSTTAQNRMMHALFREAECTDRDERLVLTGILLKRELDTSAGLTVQDAGVVIDALESLKAAGHPDGLAGAVAEVMNAHAHLQAEQELAEQESADNDTTTEGA